MDWRKQVEDFKKDIVVVEPSVGRMLFRAAFFGGVGSGKSVTANMVALAATPSPGLVGVVDGENSRSKISIDEASRLAVEKYGGKKEDFISRFKVVHVDPPFNPLRVIAAGEALIAAGCQTLVLDILTQCWDASGGYLDMKEEEVERMTERQRERAEGPFNEYAARKKNAQAAAGTIKQWTHNRLIHWIDECKAGVVLCFQAKNKWNPATNQVDKVETPIQESGITRTAIAVARIYAESGQGGFCDFTCLPGQTKYSSVELLRVLPQKQQMTFDHAEKMVEWFNTRAGGLHKAAVVPSASKPESQPSDPVKQKAALGKRLATLLADTHKVTPAEAKTEEGRKTRTQRMETWLVQHSILSDTETLAGLSVERLTEVVNQAEKQVNGGIIP